MNRNRIFCRIEGRISERERNTAYKTAGFSLFKRAREVYTIGTKRNGGITVGKRSIKENKNIYQQSRESCGLSREAAAEILEFVSADRIEKIESGKSAPHPDEVLVMEKGYKNPALSNYYCTHECPIGMKYEQEASLKELPHLTVELLSALHALEQEKDRLIDISADGRVNSFERGQFDVILKKLAALDRTIRGMRIWIEHALYSGKMDEAE